MTFDTPHRRPLRKTGPTWPIAGFTLIELLIVVAVIGILAAIAYPNYTRYVKEARVTDGKSLILNVAGRLERCYTLSSSYANCIAAGEFPLPSDERFYEITSGNYEASFATFTIRATGNTDVVKCGWLELDQAGNRSSDDGCW